jgi:hypothetical protein
MGRERGNGRGTREGYFLEEVEGWDWWAEGGELTVFEPDVVEVD